MKTRPVTFRERAARASAPLLAVLALGATAAVYYPVTRTYFYADDFVVLLQIAERGFGHFVPTVFGGHILFLRNFVFYLSYQAFGFHPEPYYWTAFGTHLLNVWLLFRVIRGLTDDAPIAALGATAWGVCPLCVGTIGWYAAYGHALVGTLLLAVLDQVTRDRAPSFGRVAAWCLLLLAGTTCFGVGVGVALVFPLTLFLLTPDAFRDRRVRLLAVAFPFVVVAFFFAYRWLSGLLDPPPVSEAAALRFAFHQLGTIAIMLGHLFAVGVAAVVLGFDFSPNAYPGTASHLAVAAYVACVLAAMAAGDGRLRRQLAGLLLLSLGAYTLIAIGRANFLLALRMPLSVAARQLRYQYVGLLPLVIVACLVLDRACRWRRVPLPSGVVLALWLVVTFVAFQRSGWRVDERVLFRRQIATARTALDVGIDEHPAGSDAYLTNDPLPLAMFGPAYQRPDFPGSVALFALLYPDDVVRDRRVRFVEPDEKLLAAIRSGRHPRLSALLVGPDARPTELR